MLRRDIRDNLIELLFKRYKLNLLSIARSDVDPGQLVAAVGDQAFGPMDASGLIDNFTISAARTELFADIEESWTDVRLIEAQLSFLQKLFANILPASWLPEVSATAKSNGASKSQAQFGEVTRIYLDISDLARALAGKAIDLSIFAGDEPVNLYVITDVFRAKSFKLAWLDNQGNELAAKLGLPQIASLEGAREVATKAKGSQTATGDSNPCFGVRLLPISLETGGARLALKHSRVDVLGEDGAESDFCFVNDFATLKFAPPPLHPKATDPSA